MKDGNFRVPRTMETSILIHLRNEDLISVISVSPDAHFIFTKETRSFPKCTGLATNYQARNATANKLKHTLHKS